MAYCVSTMKKISFTIISLSFLFWSFQGQATQFSLDGNGSEIELSDSEKEELAVIAVRFLHENKTGEVPLFSRTVNLL